MTNLTEKANICCGNLRDSILDAKTRVTCIIAGDNLDKLCGSIKDAIACVFAVLEKHNAVLTTEGQDIRLRPDWMTAKKQVSLKTEMGLQESVNNPRFFSDVKNAWSAIWPQEDIKIAYRKSPLGPEKQVSFTFESYEDIYCQISVIAERTDENSITIHVMVYADI